jgi:hypothetical protein
MEVESSYSSGKTERKPEQAFRPMTLLTYSQSGGRRALSTSPAETPRAEAAMCRNTNHRTISRRMRGCVLQPPLV